MAIATNAQKIAGLYTAFFERAPDAAGLAYWEDQFTGTATVADLAIEFAAHDVFTSTYGNMTDVQFVEAIYQNVLGAAGDAAGIDYWVAEIKAGGENARAEMVAQFVEDALTIDLAEFTDLTPEELAVAQGRQDTLTNKVEAGLYFTEKFGAQSNVSGEGELTQDPAYLAAQAAISNVTADPASVAAAKSRIDIAVSTDDAVDSLIGQNSELTAALVDLQNKVAAQADAKTELAALVTEEWDTLNEAQQNTAVDGLNPLTARNNAEQAVAAAKQASADANVELASERSEASDAELDADVTAALAAVNADADAKELLATLTAAKAKVDAGSDLTVLTALKTALANFVEAGGKASALVGASNVGQLITDVNTALAVKDNPATADVNEAAVELDAAVGRFDDTFELELASTATPQVATPAEKALQDAIDAVVVRKADKAAETAAQDAFADNDLGEELIEAEAAVDVRDGLIKAADDAAAAVTAAEAKLAAVQQAYDAYVAAGEAVAAAEAFIESDLGFKIGTIGTDSPTSNDDLFVADLTTDGIIAAGFAAGDQLFIGTEYQFGGAETVAKGAELFKAGDASALEVFFLQDAGNAQVHIETKAFANAGGSATDGVDITVITLTGVSIADLSFDNGFVSIA